MCLADSQGIRDRGECIICCRQIYVEVIAEPADRAHTVRPQAALPGLSKDDIRVSLFSKGNSSKQQIFMRCIQPQTVMYMQVNVNGDVLTIYVPTEEEKATEVIQATELSHHIRCSCVFWCRMRASASEGFRHV